MRRRKNQGDQATTRRRVVSDDTDEDVSESEHARTAAASFRTLNLEDNDGVPEPGPSRAGRAGSRDQRSNRNRGARRSTDIPPKSGNRPRRGGKKEIRKEFSTLIENCQELEEKEGFDKPMEEMMSKNIGKGQQLFDQIGGGPSDMYLAFMHTRICSGMLKYKTASIGSNISAFKVELFLNSLMEKCVGTDGEYSVEEATKYISSSAADCCRTLNPLVALVGAFEQKPAMPKEKEEKKQRGPIRKRQFDESVSSHATHRELNTQNNRGQGSKQDSHETFSKQILTVLKRQSQNAQDLSMNIFEFVLNKTSFANTIESLFYVAFLVRDGDVRFFRQDNQPNHDYTISVMPDRPPEAEKSQKGKNRKSHQSSERSQFILSFSLKQWKELSALSSGENIIAEHKRQLNNDDEVMEGDN